MTQPIDQPIDQPVDQPVTQLVLGPSLGTTGAACWGPTIQALRAAGSPLEVVLFELPGHAPGVAVPEHPVATADLAAALLAQVDGPFVYAGDSVGGQIGLQLLLDAPDRVLGAVLCCTGAKIGDASTWTDRVAQVRDGGTAGLVEATRERWFAPGFEDREPARAAALLDALRATDDDGYVAVCGALAGFDARDRLGEIDRPVVAIAGAVDPVCPVELLEQIATGVQDGRLVVLDDVAHQAPAEAPDRVAAEITALVQRLQEGRS